jgi:hypothetical protein
LEALTPNHLLLLQTSMETGSIPIWCFLAPLVERVSAQTTTETKMDEYSTKFYSRRYRVNSRWNLTKIIMAAWTYSESKTQFQGWLCAKSRSKDKIYSPWTSSG